MPTIVTGSIGVHYLDLNINGVSVRVPEHSRINTEIERALYPGYDFRKAPIEIDAREQCQPSAA